MIHALHGAVGHHSDWRPIIAQLAARGHAAKAVDLWRFLDCCSMSLSKAGASINHEAEAHPDGDRILVGYSMGGRLALHALLENPELWKAAVLIAPHTGLVSDHDRSERLKSDAVWASKALEGDWLEFLSEWNQQGILSDTQPPDRRFLKQRRRSIALSFTAWSLGLQEDLTSRLKDIKCPILWVTGSQDTKFTTIAREAAQELPTARHQVIENAHHRLIFSHPREIAAGIETFLSDLT